MVAPCSDWPAGHIETIFKLLDLGAHGAQILGDQSDAVGFLDAKFSSIADADAAAGVGRDGGKHGQFIDQLGGEGSAYFGRAEPVLRSA